MIHRALGYLLIGLAILGISCADKKEGIATPKKSGKIEASIRLAETAYALGSPIDFSMVVRNASKDTVRLTFPNTCRADFVVMRDGAEVWNLMNGKMCAQVISRASLAPGDSAVFGATWDGHSATDRISLGEYSVKGILLTNPRIQTEPVHFHLVD